MKILNFSKRNKTIVAKYMAGSSAQECAVEFKISRQRVHQVLHQQGVKSFSRQLKKSVPKGYHQIKLISEKFGVSSIMYVSDKLGINLIKHKGIYFIDEKGMKILKDKFPGLKKPKCLNCKKPMVKLITKYGYCHRCINNHKWHIPILKEMHKRNMKKWYLDNKAKKKELTLSQNIGPLQSNKHVV